MSSLAGHSTPAKVESSTGPHQLLDPKEHGLTKKNIIPLVLVLKTFLSLNRQKKRCIVLIGSELTGFYSIGPEVKKIISCNWSISKVTFTHWCRPDNLGILLVQN